MNRHCPAGMLAVFIKLTPHLKKVRFLLWNESQSRRLLPALLAFNPLNRPSSLGVTITDGIFR